MKKIVISVEIDMTPEEIAEIESWRTPSGGCENTAYIGKQKKRYEKEIGGFL